MKGSRNTDTGDDNTRRWANGPIAGDIAKSRGSRRRRGPK